MNDQEVVLYDAESIYIGNIFTIDSDMNLPSKGQLGSTISWKSNYDHIIDNKGKVTRPRCGTGNRDVTLVATVSFGEALMSREFEITVLEQKSKDVIKEVLPLRNEILLGSEYRLPKISIVKMEEGFYSTISVTWEDEPDFSKLPIGKYRVFGEKIKDYDGLIPEAIVEVVDKKEKSLLYKKPLEEFELSDVILNNHSIFYENKNRVEEYLLGVDDDKILYNFRKQANLDTKGALPMSGWDAPECLLRGHTSGHYLSAISLAYEGSIENKEVFKGKIDYLIQELALCQEAMENDGKYSYGFLSAYSEDQFDKLEQYEVYPKIWAPYYTLHKIMAGLLDCYEFGKNELALIICSKIGIFVYNRLSKLNKDKLNKMWSMYIAGEFGGMNEVLARLYKFNKKEEYLKASKFFDNERLFIPMSKNIDTLSNIHANQHVPQIIGALEIYDKTFEKIYFDIADNFWEFVTKSHIYNIGGAGEGEMFKEPNKISKFLTEKTAESCVSYNMLKLTKMLFKYSKNAKYMDYYEKTLYNHIVASHDKSGPTGGSTYFMPLIPGGMREFDLKENSCCHGTGMESHVKYQESIFFKDDDIVYINLYIPSTLNLHDKNMKVTICDDFLKFKSSNILIEGNGFIEFRFRIPSWLIEKPIIKLNEKAIEYNLENGYGIVKGEFKSFDKIKIELPFSIKIDRTKDNQDIGSIFYGPLVMAIASDKDDFIEISKEDIYDFKVISDDDNILKIGEYEFIPFYTAFDVPYHSYFKIL